MLLSRASLLCGSPVFPSVTFTSCDRQQSGGIWSQHHHVAAGAGLWSPAIFCD
ncbi:hypothetical protein M430DRAFT_32709 [Amorphotheca resinae ATCC 22711]|uniref:Uncharacterized protein n=1 Tax=Amorphotheca resinae ATCC 22711 TaxID=857342 RepID=A0A2T3BFV2_AMORE|nr:hypothetical protein M430DRAFT_32709 [Amorphotheca resinae ATCC 22711]PSS28271.1 hypothetical protein M430DRAFT_32709 [Amorphotheca resinae ATCC 22711]